MSDLDHPILFLATANAERARVFYEGKLGLKFVADEPYALVFEVGQSMLRIAKVEKVKAAPYTVLGWDVSDIRETLGKLREAGVVCEHYKGMKQDADGIWQSPSGARIAWFRDPEGQVLSLTQFE